MKTKLFLISLLLLALCGAAFLKYKDVLLASIVTKAANSAASEYFQGTIRLKRVTLDRSLKIRLENLEGVLKTEHGPVPLEIASVESRGPVYEIFSKDGQFFDFKEARPKNSPRKGVSGSVQFYARKEWRSTLRLQVEALGLEEIQWLAPNDLAGSSGEMKGVLTFVSDYKKELGFFADLKIAEPGGILQERFFESLKPYLPALTQIEGKIRQDGRDLVKFRAANLTVRLLESDTLIGLFHIQVPEYNLNLNLNLTVKLDEKNAFSQLFDVMGLLKLKVES